MEKSQNYSEGELIVLLKKRDQEAFCYLYDHYAPILNGVIFRLFGNGPLAEDILIEVFLSIRKSISRYDASKETLFMWMVKVARTICNDRIRSKGSWKQFSTWGANEPVSSMIDVLLAEKRLEAIDIKKQLSRLTNEQHLIMELAYLHGYSQDEIARKTGIPQETIKASVRLAMVEFRKMLEPSCNNS